jgi:bifunctional non-homologous end joining protein LigD
MAARKRVQDDKGAGEKLGRYRAKRDFAHTPEPASASGEASGGGERRFVIHEHSARRLHWDLRMERDGVLASWAIPKGLPQEPKQNHFAAHTEDHPLEYLDFHGEIPKGQYGAGTIGIWDSGTYDCLKWEPRKIEVALHGQRLNARYALFAIEDGQDPKDWMIHRMDPADSDPIHPREPLPTHLVPMFATTGSLPQPDDGWAYEIKWDGVRAIAYSRPGELRLESRNLNDVTDRYPELARMGRALSSHSAILDGEIVALDRSGRPSFGTLQRRMQVSSRAQAQRLAKDTPVTYMIFDLLWLDGHSVMGLTYSERRELLSALELNGESWQTPEHTVGDGKALLQASTEQGLEGVMAKRLDSTYQPGARGRNWVKIKGVRRQELVVGGWLPGKGKREERIGALLVGVYEQDGALRYVGRVGSGFSEQELDRLERLLGPLRLESSPFGAGVRPPREAVFCEPKLVAEVEFSEWTSGGSLRQPRYKGLRDDKVPREVVREEPPLTQTPASVPPRGSRDPRKLKASEISTPLVVHEKTAKSAETTVEGHELKLSNLAKVLYPATGLDKRALIDYYATIAPVLIPHLAGRALTVTRWPDGVDGKSFFQKQAPAHRPEWVKTATLASERKPIDYVLADDLPTLVWLANLAAIELHVPLARADCIERPTALVFDLDPGAPASIVECCRVALQLQGMFEGLGLQSFAKTSGSKGLQVYVPLNTADVTFERTKTFAKAVAETLEAAQPDLVVSRMTKARRTGKVLIDWSQNDAKKTTVCVYSLRALERPPASTPGDWVGVRGPRDSEDPASLAFEAGQVLERVARGGDLFASVLSLVQELPG